MISAVIAVYNEAACLPTLYERLTAVLSSLGCGHEIIFINDGSTDSTWPIIEDLHHKDPRVKGIRIETNHGHQIAFYTGLLYASGKIILWMDGDLQHPPEVVADFYKVMQETAAELVYGYKMIQKKRGALKKWLNQSFHRIFGLIHGIRMHPETSDFQLIQAALVSRILNTWHAHVFMRGWIHYLAKDKMAVPFTAEARRDGRSRQHFGRLLRIGLSALFRFPHQSMQAGAYRYIPKHTLLPENLKKHEVSHALL